MASVAPRIVARLRREIALTLARARWPRVQFGSRSDIRRGLNIVLGRGATISFGEGCVLDRHLTVESEGVIVVGARTIFGHHCTIGAKESVLIGQDCLIAEMVSIRDSDHVISSRGTPYREQGHVTSPVVIGSNVWLGSKAVVARGVSIGDNAVVGAGAVVTRDIPPNSVAVGVPARVIRDLTVERED